MDLALAALLAVVDHRDQQVDDHDPLDDDLALSLSRLPSAIGVVPMLAPRWVIAGTGSCAAAAPTTVTLARAFPARRAGACREIAWLRLTGLSRLKSGLSSCGVGRSPTWTTWPITPPAMQMPPIGSAVVSSVCSAIEQPLGRRRRPRSGLGDRGEQRAHRARRSSWRSAAPMKATEQPGDEDQRAVEIGALGHLALAARLCPCVGGCLLCLVVAAAMA